jgi:phage terminase large subunit GpA-like protein
LPEDVKAMAKDLGEKVVPEGVRFLTATVDVQFNRFEVQVLGFGVGGDIYVIDRFPIKKSERLDEDGERERVKPASYVEDWKLLIPQVILKDYPLADESGRRMKIMTVGCDTGGSSDKKNDSSVTKVAYEFYRLLRDSDGEGDIPEGLHHTFRLLKGGSTKDAPRVKLSFPDSERKDRSAAARGEIPVLVLNTTTLKDQLNVMLDRRMPGGGMIHIPDWLPDWWYSEICAEVRETDGWKLIAKRNEAWDLLAYGIALSLYRPIKIEHLDWSNPPSWADEWDDNEMVFMPDDGKKPVAKKTTTTLSDLSSLLA